MSEKVIAPVGDKQLIIETGKLAKQADGAVSVQLGETIVIVAAVAATKAKPGQEFFPLTVDYREKAAAAGKFPGGYFKREGRPTEKEILTCRLIDRPIRPLFPKGWYNEVQVQCIVLSADGENDPDMLALIGASAALMLSDIPWAGPIGAVRVGRVGGQFVANPTHTQMLESDLDLVYVGNESDMVMYEGSAKEITDADFNAALKFGQEAIQPAIAAQKELVARVGKPKRQITLNVVPDEILKEAKALAGDRIVAALLTPGKLDREGAVAAITEEIGKKLVEKFGEEKVTEFVLKDAFYYIQKESVRGLIMNQGKRLDGRDFETVRPIVSEVGILPRAHGSAHVPARGDAGRHALHPGHRRRRPGVRLLHRRRHARRNSSCTITSRTSPSAKPAASAVRAGGRLATAHWPSVRSNRWCRRRPTPIPFASPARSWSPTAPPRWPRSAAAAWR